MNQFPALDSNQVPPVLQQWFSTGGSAEGAPLKAAIRLKEHQDLAGEWVNDPLWQAVEVLAAGGSSYDGLAHMRAADALIEAGQSERAFQAMTAAGYFRRAFGHKPSVQIVETALRIAEKQGWADLAAIIRDNVAAAA